MEERPFMAALPRECELRPLGPDPGAKAQESFLPSYAALKSRSSTKSSARRSTASPGLAQRLREIQFGKENRPANFGPALDWLAASQRGIILVNRRRIRIRSKAGRRTPQPPPGTAPLLFRQRSCCKSASTTSPPSRGR